MGIGVIRDEIGGHTRKQEVRGQWQILRLN